MYSPKRRRRRPHDQAFKAICSHPTVVEHAIRRYAVRPFGPLRPATADAMNFATLEKLPAEWIGEGFRRHLGDQAWRVRFRWAEDWADPAGWMLILVEFQSSPHPGMARRMAGYAMDLYRELVTTGVLRPRGLHPPVFPLVVHNGKVRWSAPTELADRMAVPTPPRRARHRYAEAARVAAEDLAAFQVRHAYFPLDFAAHSGNDPHAEDPMSVLIGLENVRAAADLPAVIAAAADLRDAELREKMVNWTLRRLDVAAPLAQEMRKMANLGEFHSQLSERMEGWAAKYRAEGVAQGRAEGMARVAQGVAAQRTSLERMAALRFGTEAAAVGPILAGIDSPALLAQVGEWLMTDPLDELLAKLEAAASESRAH